MTYTQLRKHLAAIAAFGNAGAPTDAIGRQRLVMLRGAKCVVGPICDRWTLTRLGETIVGEHAMPARRPEHRPVQRKGDRKACELRVRRQKNRSKEGNA